MLASGGGLLRRDGRLRQGGHNRRIAIPRANIALLAVATGVIRGGRTAPDKR